MKNVIWPTILVVILSILAAVAGSFHILHSYRETLQREYFEDIRQDLEMIRRESNDSNFIQKRLNFVYGKLSEELIKPETIQAFLDRVKAEGLNFASFRFFNENAQHIQLKGESDLYHTLIGKVFKALVQPELEGKTDLLASYRPLFQSFLGKINPVFLANEKSSLVNVQLGGSPGWFYWNSFFSHLESGKFKGGMIVFFENHQIPRDFALRRLIIDSSVQAEEKTVFAVVDQGNVAGNFNLSRFFSGSGLDFAGLKKVLQEFETDYVYEKTLTHGILSALPIESGRFILAFRPFSGFGSFFYHFFLKIFWLTMLMMLVGKAFHSPGFAEKIIGGRLNPGQYLLIGSLMPLVGLIFLGSYAVFLNARAGQQESSQNLLGTIRAVDEHYGAAVVALEKKYSDLAAEICCFGAEGAIKRLEDACEKHELKKVFVINKEGAVRFSYPDSGKSGGILGKLLPAMSRRLFSMRFARPGGWKSRINDMMFDAMSENLDEFIGDAESRASFLKIFERNDQIIELPLANQKFYLYSTFVESGEKKEPLLLVFWNEALGHSEAFLKQQVLQHIHRGGRFNKDGVQLAMKSRLADRMPFPGEMAKYSFSGEMFEKVLATENLQSRIVDKDGGRFMVVASPMKKIPGFILFAMKSIDENEADFQALAAILAAFLISSLAIVKVFHKKI